MRPAASRRSVSAVGATPRAEDAQADALYRQAIQLLEGAHFPGQLARTRLLYGEWLRRQGRRVAPREQLRAASGAFTALGAETFNARSRSGARRDV